MPALRPHRREVFAHMAIKAAKTGKPQSWAYKQSGYNTDGNSAEAAASRLLSDVKVQMRIDELTRPAVKKTGVSVESLLLQLDETIADARKAKQHSVVVQCLSLSAKLVGLLRDRVEVGSPGDFDHLDAAGAIEQVRLDHGEEAAKHLALAFAASTKAIDHVAWPEHAERERPSEASAELLKTLKPTR
jgi:hypothetical protein